MTVDKELDSLKILSFFRAVSERGSDSTRKSYAKAIGVLEAFIKKTEKEEVNLTDTFLSEWLLYMSLRGLTVKTAIHYFDAISSLYKVAVSEGLLPPTGAFKTVRERLADRRREGWDQPVTEDEFKRLVNLTQTAYHQKGSTALASDLVLFSLLNTCLPLTEAALLKTSAIEGMDEESRSVAERECSPRRRYIFPLRQSETTPLRLEHSVNSLVMSLFRMRNIPLKGNIQDTLASYWLYAGLRCGFSGEDMVSCLGRSSNAIPFLSLFRQKTLADERRKEITDTVGKVFIVNPLHWFAMRLRPSVKFEDLSQRFTQINDEFSIPEIFYPKNEIVRRVGKKLKYESKPVISDVVFFRTRLTEIFPLFCRIGDLAWCYTTGGRNSRRYASISDEAFKTFQQAIGQFTPDFEVAPVGQLPMREGDRIVIVGGMLPGRTGEVAKIETDNSDNVIYRVKFGSENGFKWDFGVDARITKEKKG